MKYLGQLKPNQLKNKTCLLRVDLNIESPGKDAFRLQAILPTIKFLIKNGVKVVILSHRGRPLKATNEKRQATSYSLKSFAKILSRLIKKPVHFIDFKKGFNVSEISDTITRDSILLLENLRFLPEEEKNDKDFAKALASLGDIFINDAFAVSHRKNASVEAITHFLPSYAGLLLEKEIENLDAVMKKFKKPLVIILGGAKVSDKIGLINNFLKKADYFLIGGAMANTFFALQGLPVGDSFYEKIRIDGKITREITRKIILPIDAVLYKRKILDIGRETAKKYNEIIQKAETIIWNGPMGMFEDKKFAKGTEEIAAAVFKNKKAKIVIGGGETIASLKISPYEGSLEGRKNQKSKIKSNVFFSTGGGAMLEYLAGEKLPGIEALKNN
ncbi:MAG: phosphoglycerate kinase [bacterium]|nr:phosphoglycerate kinase [bacterium]